jgi:cytoskeletal protein RodZ
MDQTIGQQLKQARLAKNLSLAQVSQATRIRVHYLEALEADDFESLPSAVQARGFLKLYADYLGLSLEELFARQRAATLANQPSAAPTVTAEAAPAPSAAPPQPNGVRRKKAAAAAESETTQEVPVQAPAPDPETGSRSVPDKPASPSTSETFSAPSASQTVFNEIGLQLRQRRERLGLSLDKMEQHTRVRRHFLEAMENGEFWRLPSSVQGRGMLQSYAQFLELDVDTLLLRYAEGIQLQWAERHSKPQPATPKTGRLTLPPALRQILSPDMLVGVGIGILLIVLVVLGAKGIVQSTTPTPQPTLPSILDILIKSPESTLSLPQETPSMDTTAVPTGEVTAAAITLPPAGTEPVQVVLVANRNAWMKVVVDGKIEFEGRAVAGTAYSYAGLSQVEVLTGDGGAISVIYNQSNLGPLGNYGEVVNRIYTASSILIPTATFTPSPTITPTFTVTPRPSATPRPSSTPRPSATPKP